MGIWFKNNKTKIAVLGWTLALIFSTWLVYGHLQDKQAAESVRALSDAIETDKGGLRTEMDPLETAAGGVERSRYEEEGVLGLTYRFPNGDLYYQEEAVAATGGSRLAVKSRQCRLRYYDMEEEAWVLMDPDRDWREAQDLQTTVFLSFDNCEMMLCPPMAYRQGENDTLRWQPEEDGAVSVVRVSDDEWEVRAEWPRQAGEETTLYWWTLLSEENLIDWNDPVMKKIWPGLQLTGDTRWCGDGCYNPVPEEYIPNGGDHYFRNPASYIPVKFILVGDCRAADELGVAMLDIIRGNYNEAGFIPMTVQCSWLQEDYGIGAGYFDTRWNTDVAGAFLSAGKRLGIPAFTDTAMRYAAFLGSHVQKNSFNLKGHVKSQLMVADYSDSRGNGVNYASLNHQLAELLFLYQTGEQEYMEQARRMLEGVKSVGGDWIKSDGNLQYAVLPDGSFTGQDYPYLTYNDLYAVQEWLQDHYGERDPVLDDLMDAKRGWMEKNDISGYRK